MKKVTTSLIPQLCEFLVIYGTSTRFRPLWAWSPPRHTEKGDRGRTGPPFSHDMWSYTAPVDETHPLQEHVDVLWALLKPNKGYLLDLKKAATVDVFLGYRSNCDTAGVDLSHTSLEMFIDLEIPFGISIIVT